MLVIFALLFSAVLYSKPQHDEYFLKAVFIMRINDYITWPNWKINNAKKSFKIGVLGKSRIIKTLESIYKDKKVFNKKVDIAKIPKNNYKKFIKELNILFIAIKNKNTIKSCVKLAKKYNILLIGDSPNFAKLGIHINFYIKNNRLRFEINRASLLQSNLSVSSVLLSLAKLVNSGDIVE